MDSDVPMFFPETYVPGVSERIMLYRELDSISDDSELQRYRQRLADRFGTPPRQAEALMLMPALRRKARALGVEKVFMKNKSMTLFFVSNNASPFYKSMKHLHRCKLDETNGKRKMLIANIPTPEAAITVLDEILVKKED